MNEQEFMKRFAVGPEADALPPVLEATAQRIATETCARNSTYPVDAIREGMRAALAHAKTPKGIWWQYLE